MIKRIIPIALSLVLFMSGCSSTKKDNNNVAEKEEVTYSLTYSNLIDNETKDEVKNTLIQNKIDEKQADQFIKLVNEYNSISDVEKIKTSKPGYTTINDAQVPYDEIYLNDKWTNVEYIDYNCRLTAFTIFKDYINSQGQVNDENGNLIFDINAMENNPVSNFTQEDIEQYINLYTAVSVEGIEDISEFPQAIMKEWEKRKISFGDSKEVSMISGFVHYPDEKEMFIGHVGICTETSDGVLFIEKYGQNLPIQVSKFNNKSEIKAYLMNRLDITFEDDKTTSKPIIMENDKLL